MNTLFVYYFLVYFVFIYKNFFYFFLTLSIVVTGTSTLVSCLLQHQLLLLPLMWLLLLCSFETSFLAPPKQVAPVQAQHTGGSSESTKHGCLPVGLPQLLQMEEKKFLLAVERGDMANVRR